MVTYCIEQCLKNPNERIHYGAAFQTDLTKFILPAFHIILQDCPDELRPRYKASTKTWHFLNGAEIKLIGIDKNPDGLRGNALSKIVVDEAAFVANLHYLYSSVIIPATMKQTGIKILFISTPPESPEHFFVELIKRAEQRGSYMCQTIDDISDLPYAERERCLTETGGEESVASQREWFCRILISEDRAIAPDFKDSLHVSSFDSPGYGVWLLAGDTADVRDKNYFLRIVYDYLGGKILVVDEAVFDRKTPISIMVPKVLKLEGGIHHTRVVDSAYHTEMAHQGFAAAPPTKDSFEAGLTLLRNVFFKQEILIHERCKFLIQTLNGGMLNKQRTDYERTESLGHCDAAQTLIYGIRHVNKHTNPYPNTLHPANHYTAHQAPLTSNEQTLKNLFY
jgi:hypothetical protein